MTLPTAWRTGWAVVGLVCWLLAGTASAQETRAPVVVVEANGVTVVAHSPSHQTLAERVAKLYGETHAVVQLRLGRGVEGHVQIALAAIRGGGHHPSNAVGLARWGNRQIIIDPYRLGITAPLQSVLAHEVSHLVVGQASQGGAPAWFDEGVAEWIGSAYGVQDRAAFLQANLPHLKDLEASFPHDPDASRIAYAASRETIVIITERLGDGAIPQVVRYLDEGQPFREALRRATGKGPASWDLELHARRAEGPGFIRQWFEANPSTVWVLVFAVMGLVSVYAAIVRRRVAQAKLDEAEPDVPAPDALPDPDSAMLEHEVEFSGGSPDDDPMAGAGGGGDGGDGNWEPEPDDESWRGGIH